MCAVPDLQYVAIKYFVLGDVHRCVVVSPVASCIEGVLKRRLFHWLVRGRLRVTTVQVDRHWFPMSVRCRDDYTGFWLARTCCDPPPQPTPAVHVTNFPRSSSAFADRISPSLVTVEFHTPFMVDGVHASSFVGVGVVVDAEKGYVITDRNTTAIALGDIVITVASSVEVPGACFA